MTSLEALVAFRNGGYRQLNYDRLIEAVDVLNRKIADLEGLLRSKQIEPSPELQSDLRSYRDAKEAFVKQLNLTTSDFQPF